MSLMLPDNNDRVGEAELQAFNELKVCEDRMFQAAKAQIVAGYQIGFCLNKIEDEQLYLQSENNYKSFHAYLLSLPWSKPYSYNVQLEARVYDAIQKANLPAPPHSSFLLEMGRRLTLDGVAEFWAGMIEGARRAKLPIKLTNLVRAIEAMPEPAAVPPPPTRAGVKVDFDFSGVDDDGAASAGTVAEPEPVEKQQLFGDKGEEALDRIGRLCGSSVANAIKSGNLQIGERSLQKWAEEDDITVKVISYYVADEGWSVEKALRYERKSVTDNLTLGQMIDWARARGGAWIRSYEGFRISIQNQKNETATTSDFAPA